MSFRSTWIWTVGSRLILSRARGLRLGYASCNATRTSKLLNDFIIRRMLVASFDGLAGTVIAADDSVP
jgi:hypothetical protein